MTFFSRIMHRKILSLIVFALIVISALFSSGSLFLAQAQSSPSNPLAINTNEFAFYTTGLQSMFNTLLNSAPCGSGLTALHEAPSVPYNWWTDDNAKALGALSYVYPNYATQDQELLSFIQHNTLNGYLSKRCQQVTPSIVNS
ncbi:MAG: hypothetical protein JRN15_12425, partial [Nitrososphaerota archaeon]|nr:hypothetical protein [Nitrososphaerota archaeon]